MSINSEALAGAFEQLALAATTIARVLRQNLVDTPGKIVGLGKPSEPMPPTVKRGFRITKPIVEVILQNAGKTPAEICQLCTQRGINAKLATVRNLRRYVRITIEILVEMRGGEAAPDRGRETAIARLVLSNPDSDLTQTANMCATKAIGATLSTIKNVYEYTRLTCELVGDFNHVKKLETVA